MFFKKFKSIILLFLLSFFIIPLNIKAYSDYIIASGENIGIKLNSDGIIIVGTYKINNKNPGIEAGLEIGDKIISINNVDVKTISEMVKEINKNKNEKINIKFLRANKEKETELQLYNDNGNYKYIT